MKKWYPFSYEHHPISQKVEYENLVDVRRCIAKLQQLPPLVTPSDIQDLKTRLAHAGEGRAFILQGGDCSEQFIDCHQEQIANKYNILSQMSIILMQGLKKPIIRVGRIAGQYAKPRSFLEETINGVTLPAYRGDIINSHEFTWKARQADPMRMLLAYQHAQVTMNYLQQLTQGSFFTSHEALHLPYEAALTRQVAPEHFYNLGTHFPWIGVRTLSLDSAHVEYLSGIDNPIGIKIGQDINLDELMQIIRKLNPYQEPGKIVLVHRFGKEAIGERLPLLLKTIAREKMVCTVICDPMHGNTVMTQQGIKTRYFDDILHELNTAITIHNNSSIAMAGIHVEMTGEHVTECIGGFGNIKVDDLHQTYKSLVDPRLNYQQSLELVWNIVKGAYG